jgi:hypothetical protein
LQSLAHLRLLAEFLFTLNMSYEVGDAAFGCSDFWLLWLLLTFVSLLLQWAGSILQVAGGGAFRVQCRDQKGLQNARHEVACQMAHATEKNRKKAQLIKRQRM